MSAGHLQESSGQPIGIAAQPSARADYEVAGLGRRLVAGILDCMCLSLIGMGVFLVLTSFNSVCPPRSCPWLWGPAISVSSGNGNTARRPANA